MNKGKVYLIGVGPGDPELLTLKAVRILAKVDIVLIDSLVEHSIRHFLRPQAQVIEVGKRGGQPSTDQAEINQMLVEYARQGLLVARVKGGDPFIFGRGGEELAVLNDAEIETEVLGGLTAGIALPGNLQVPLTHRDLAKGVSFISGCNKTFDNDYQWHELISLNHTLVIYMGLNKVQDIADPLIASGMARGTPAMAVQDGSLATEKAVFAPLLHLARAIKQEQLQSPTLIVIGEVVALSPHWDEENIAQALYGANILVEAAR